MVSFLLSLIKYDAEEDNDDVYHNDDVCDDEDDDDNDGSNLPPNCGPLPLKRECLIYDLDSRFATFFIAPYDAPSDGLL